jgi:uncharacterized damage-inducible protein DinB
MTLSELRTAFDRETATTRRVLERVPEAKTSYRPHPKSWTLGELSLHVANIPYWAALTLTTERLDLAPPDGEPFPPPTFRSAAATLEHFDEKVAQSKSAFAKASDSDLSKTWTLLHGGHEIFARPKGEVLRNAVLDHGIHHRGQLTVYLRLCDVALPSIYGPTADDPTGSGG